MPGVPSILQAMIPLLEKIIKTGKKILSVSIDTDLRESSLADELAKIQLKYSTVDIGSYPYFKDKPGTILVLRSTDEGLIKKCQLEVNELVGRLK